MAEINKGKNFSRKAENLIKQHEEFFVQTSSVSGATPRESGEAFKKFSLIENKPLVFGVSSGV